MYSGISLTNANLRRRSSLAALAQGTHHQLTPHAVLPHSTSQHHPAPVSGATDTTTRSGQFTTAEQRLLRDAYLSCMMNLDTMLGVEQLLEKVGVVAVPPSLLHRTLATIGVRLRDSSNLMRTLSEEEFLRLAALLCVSQQTAPTQEEDERQQLVDLFLWLRHETGGISSSSGSATNDASMSAAELAAVRLPVMIVEAALRKYSIEADVCATTGITAQYGSLRSVAPGVTRGHDAAQPPATVSLLDLAAALSADEELVKARRVDAEKQKELLRMERQQQVVMAFAASAKNASATLRAQRDRSLKWKAACMNLDALVRGSSRNRRLLAGRSNLPLENELPSAPGTDVRPRLSGLRRGISFQPGGSSTYTAAASWRSGQTPSESESTSAEAISSLPASLKIAAPAEAAPGRSKSSTLPPLRTITVAGASSRVAGGRNPTATHPGAEEADSPPRRRSPRPWHVNKTQRDPATVTQEAEQRKMRIKASRCLPRCLLGVSDEELQAELEKRGRPPRRLDNPRLVHRTPPPPKPAPSHDDAVSLFVDVSPERRVVIDRWLSSEQQA